MKHSLARSLVRALEARINNLAVRKKFNILFLGCVLMPLMLTDGLIIAMLGHSQRQAVRRDVASAAAYTVNSVLEQAGTVSNNIYISRTLNAFLDQEFASALDYYCDKLELGDESLLIGTFSSSVQVMMFGDNPTIVNGGHFQRLDNFRETGWYRAFRDSGLDTLLYAGYSASNTSFLPLRHISLLRRMNYFGSSGEKLMKIDLDYAALHRTLTAANYGADVYICMGDRILLTNAGVNDRNEDFQPFTEALRKKVSQTTTLSIYGETISIHIIDRPFQLASFLKSHWPVLLLLVGLNLALPSIFIALLSSSFVGRLTALSDTVRQMDAAELPVAVEASGEDEIGVLMRNYNDMTRRIGELVETVYKSRLRAQEIDLARQNAELLALRSQINPHFLFNALESIRMRSLLKREEETAEMINRLAVIERQYVDWKSDLIPLKEELRHAVAYLELQKYRFGDRFSYRVTEGPGPDIPQLTLLTFVENACVHGIAGKCAHSWIFVRISRRDGITVLEVEDTGVGMEEEQRRSLEERMNHGEFDALTSRSHIGILNACIRLRKTMGRPVTFAVESEPRVGTTFSIMIHDPENEQKGDVSDAEGSAGG